MMTLLEAVTAHAPARGGATQSPPGAANGHHPSGLYRRMVPGFSPSVTCGVWVGFDSRESLGKKETGAKNRAAIWMDVMRVASPGKDDSSFSAKRQKIPR